MVSPATGHGPGRVTEGMDMHENTATQWSFGEVVYMVWLAVMALVWVGLPMALVLAQA